MSFRLGHDRRLVRARERPGHRPGALLPEGAGAAARPRSATGRCRRSTCCPRSRTCSACEIPWKVDGRSALRTAQAAPARDRRQEVQAHLPRGHAGLRARQAGGARAQGEAVRRGHLRVRAAARPDRRHRAARRPTPSTVDPESGFVPAHVAGSDPGRRARRRSHGGRGRERPGGRDGADVHAGGGPTTSSTRWSCRSGRSSRAPTGSRCSWSRATSWSPSSAARPPRAPRPRSGRSSAAASRAGPAG